MSQMLNCKCEMAQEKNNVKEKVVKVRIDRVQHSGLKVELLESGRIGFIPQRELTWDQRINRSVPEYSKDDVIDAVIMAGKQRYDSIYLSIRQLDDPWQGARERYEVGQVVRGEIVNLRHFGAFVQIEPGITAVVWAQNIPLKAEQIPSDILAIGDRVEAVIHAFQPERQKIELNLVARLEELDDIFNLREKIQYQLFESDIIANDESQRVPFEARQADPISRGRRYHHPISRPKNVLVIENNKGYQEELRELLQEEYELEVDIVASGNEVKLLLEKENKSYDLAIVDLRLDDEKGPDVAKIILEETPGIPIIFVSSDPFARDKNAQGIQVLEMEYNRKFPFSDKDKISVSEWMDKLINGYWEDKSNGKAIFKNQQSFMDQLGISSFARRPIQEILLNQIQELRKETSASNAFLVKVDLINQKVQIIANDPQVRQEFIQFSEDGLFFSPVREIVETEEPFHGRHIIPMIDTKYKNFFPQFSYRSCYGVPFKVPDTELHYALIILDDTRIEFDRKTREQVRMASYFLQIVLERSVLFDFMQAYEERYFKGQLLGTLVHELKNTVHSLKGPANKSMKLIKDALDGTANTSQVFEGLQVRIERIQLAGDKLKNLIDSYSRLSRGELELLQINDSVKKVCSLLNLKAKEKDVHLTHNFLEVDPVVWAVPLRLEQVILNVVLNAIQQVNAQASRMKKSNWTEKGPYPILQKGNVQVITRKCTTRNSCQIIVIDTGPGIAYDRKDKIFHLGTSTRKKGQGLGLFISRNLTEAMGGKLYLLSSYRFIGSAFVIELPAGES